ncbi:hypothetical protein JMK10_13570 [Rhodovulum sulfidophilum]|nr:hypothetical protein [Rhodovulum sulfidophilum]MCF4117817.1 hypothetical protein [Rhodovulum sulfidophilum]
MLIYCISQCMAALIDAPPDRA